MSFPIYQITVDRNGSTLKINQQSVEIPPNAAVQWLITGVQNDETVALYADTSDSAELGPFTFIRRLGGNVWARGNATVSGSFGYKLAIFKLGQSQNPLEPVASSALATLVVTSSSASRSGQVIRVSYDPTVKGLVVGPFETRFLPGDPVIWEFHLPAKLFTTPWVPTVYFTNGPMVNRSFGPFAQLSIVDGAEAQSDSDGLIRRYVVGSGSANSATGRYSFQVAARAVDGSQIVSSEDPVIDNDGEATCPGC